MEEALLKVNGISKKYHSFALNEVTFSLEPGYILGLTGRNGAGKTTLIKQLLHPETAGSGSVLIAGIDAGKYPVQVKQEIGTLMEEMPFLEDWSLEKNGKLTVIPKALYAPPRAKDLHLSPGEEGLMHIVFCNRAYSQAGLSLIGKDREWLDREIARRGIDLANVFCITANESGTLCWIRKEEDQ